MCWKGLGLRFLGLVYILDELCHYLLFLEFYLIFGGYSKMIVWWVSRYVSICYVCLLRRWRCFNSMNVLLLLAYNQIFLKLYYLFLRCWLEFEEWAWKRILDLLQLYDFGEKVFQVGINKPRDQAICNDMLCSFDCILGIENAQKLMNYSWNYAIKDFVCLLINLSLLGLFLGKIEFILDGIWHHLIE